MNAAIWVTSACNLSCRYCYEGINKLNDFMAEDVADRTVDFIIEHMKTIRDNVLIVVFHGGEPLLSFNIIKRIINR